MSDSGGSRRAVVLGAVLVLVCVLAVLVLTSRAPSGEAFDVRSSAPDGFAALAALLRDRGATVVGSDAGRVAARPPGPGDVVVVPAPALASRAERAVLEGAAEGGAVIVWGEPPEDADPELVGYVPGRELADTPAEPTGPGACDVAELDGLGTIDTAFSSFFEASRADRSCYGGTPELARVAVRDAGAGRVVTLASPYLLVNARLQPDKEQGGQPLDNAAMALRLFGTPPDGATAGTRVTFVAARPSEDVEVGGPRSPVELLPVPVKLAVVQAFGAFVLYAWWRARRLGPPVRERVPVEVAGSELVVAVGDLLRRSGSPDRAAADLRGSVRRSLATRLGLPLGAPVEVVVGVVAARTGRPPGEVTALLADGPVGDPEQLVRLARALDLLRQEVLDGQPVG